MELMDQYAALHKQSSAVTKLLELDSGNLSPAQVVAMVECFYQNVSHADAYLALAPKASHEVRQAWFRRRIGEAIARGYVCEPVPGQDPGA